MIYFYDDLINKTLETIKEAYDCADVTNDLNRIEQEITNIKVYGNLVTANTLDQEMREKYPVINMMVDFANSFSFPSTQVRKVYTPSDALISNLNQDYYGILCETALKKKLINDIKEFISKVD